MALDPRARELLHGVGQAREAAEYAAGRRAGTRSHGWLGSSFSQGGQGRGHPRMYGNPRPALHFRDFPEGGGYPHGFLEWAYKFLGVDDPESVCHLCSGSVTTGFRVDVRPETNPDLVADCRDTGLPDEFFDVVLADPPYSQEYARNLYGTEDAYPEPGAIMREACRILRPGGLVGLLHFQVPVIRKPLRIVDVFGVTTGAGFAIRAWTVAIKDPERM